jgi:GntR family transcriptional regulator/MocR family aminotransferase
VRAAVPDSLISVRVSRPPPRAVREPNVPAERSQARLHSRFAQIVARNPEFGMRCDGAVVPFALGMPAIDIFPSELWSRITARRWRNGAVFLGHAATAGDDALRNAIAAYVTSSRGARCSPEQIFIVSGAQQALDLAARVLIEAGDAVWVEDPGYAGARAARA